MVDQPGTRRGGQEPAAGEHDRPEQNVGYDEAAKGEPLSDAERERAERDSPLVDDLAPEE